MTGGMAFVYDEAGDFPLYVNPTASVWQRLESQLLGRPAEAT